MWFLLSIGWLSATLAAGTLGSTDGSGVKVVVVGRELAIVSCDDLINRSCLSPIEKLDYGDGFSPPQPDNQLSDGRHRWRNNLGWGIHGGII